MPVVWVVRVENTSHILGIFSTFDKAVKFVGICSARCTINRWELDNY